MEFATGLEDGDASPEKTGLVRGEASLKARVTDEGVGGGAEDEALEFGAALVAESDGRTGAITVLEGVSGGAEHGFASAGAAAAGAGLDGVLDIGHRDLTSAGSMGIDFDFLTQLRGAKTVSGLG
ncbi:MAG: hypothetical protein HY858_10685 [Candidatus Solibacter usitatus]|nr:hypothetical protein [Candidatus Solibacter usitatus]